MDWSGAKTAPVGSGHLEMAPSKMTDMSSRGWSCGACKSSDPTYRLTCSTPLESLFIVGVWYARPYRAPLALLRGSMSGKKARSTTRPTTQSGQIRSPLVLWLLPGMFQGLLGYLSLTWFTPFILGSGRIRCTHAACNPFCRNSILEIALTMFRSGLTGAIYVICHLFSVSSHRLGNAAQDRHL